MSLTATASEQALEIHLREQRTEVAQSMATGQPPQTDRRLEIIQTN